MAFHVFSPPACPLFFFFNDTATTEIYTLSLHDALPICPRARDRGAHERRLRRLLRRDRGPARHAQLLRCGRHGGQHRQRRSEEHTSELQSLAYLVCRLLLEKKKKHKRSHEHAVTACNRD